MSPEELITEFVVSTLGAGEAFRTDPVFHMQVKWLRVVLERVDAVIAAEGAGPVMRERIARAVLAGVVDDPRDALARVAARVDAARRAALN